MKKQLALVLVLAMVMAGTIGCSPNAPGGSNSTNPPTTSAGNTSASQSTVPPSTIANPTRNSLRLAVTETFTMIDPHYQYRAVDATIITRVFEPLIYMTPQGDFEPHVSTSYEVSDDGLVYTIHLRKGVKFHSGGEMKASDVLFSIERAKQSPTMLLSTDPIDKVEAPDDYTVVITLKEINPMYHHLCYFGIMSEEAGKNLEPGFKDVNCGTGPYMIDSFKGDEKVVLTSFKDWYLDLPQIETIESYVVVDATTALMAFEAGDIDYIGIPAGDWTRIANSGLYTTLQMPYTHTSYINMNQLKAPFDDVRVRQALNYAIDKEAVALAAREGLAEVAYHIGNSYYITYLPKAEEGVFETYPYNPDKARELLAEAGYAGGLTLSEPMMMLPGSHFVPATEAIQQMLADVGITVEIEMDDPAVFYSNHITGNYLCGIQGFNWNVPDWYFTERIFSTAGIGDANATFYSNPIVDELYVKARTTADQSLRTEYFTEILKILSEDAVIVPLYWRYETIAWDKDLVADPLRPVNEWYWTK